MKTAKEIRDNCDQELKLLQSICPHLESGWAHECWAPAHMTGREIRYCKNCEKHLEYREAKWEPYQQYVENHADFNTLNEVTDGIDCVEPYDKDVEL